MSLSACQGLQSCLEPRLVEPGVLGLKLAPLKSNFSQSLGWFNRPCLARPKEPKEISHSDEDDNNNNNCDNKISHNSTNGDLGGGSFMQGLTNPSNDSKEVTENEEVYVHPLVKRLSSMLSEKSLEMCTESLGSETGSDISESRCEEFSSLSYNQCDNYGKCVQPREAASKVIITTKKLHHSASFPPPLTTFSASGGTVQVRPHREGGRLVIKAVTISSCHTCFKAERGDGRLRLRFLKGYDEAAAAAAAAAAAEEEEEEYSTEEGAEEDEVDQEVEEEEDDDQEEEEEEEEMEGNSGNVEGEMGLGKLHRPSRCKEGGSGNKGMLNWKPFWVATS